MDDIVRELKIAHISYTIIYLLGFVLIELFLTIDYRVNGGNPSGLEYFVFIMYFTIISCVLLLLVDIYILWAIRDVKHPIYFVPIAFITCGISCIASIYFDFFVGSYIEMKIVELLFAV